MLYRTVDLLFACIVMLLVPIPNLTDFISIVSLS